MCSFDAIDHGWLEKMIEHRIGDRRVLNLIGRWLRAGIFEQGQWSPVQEGTPQGAVMTPRTQKATFDSIR